MHASSNYMQYIQDCKKSGVETDQYETLFPYPSLLPFLLSLTLLVFFPHFLSLS